MAQPESESVQKKPKESLWEDIDDSSDRLKVPGGWIVRSWISYWNSDGGVHQIFVVDVEHQWKIGEVIF